jgi:hypothetical protein
MGMETLRRPLPLGQEEEHAVAPGELQAPLSAVSARHLKDDLPAWIEETAGIAVRHEAQGNGLAGADSERVGRGDWFVDQSSHRVTTLARVHKNRAKASLEIGKGAVRKSARSGAGMGLVVPISGRLAT